LPNISTMDTDIMDITDTSLLSNWTSTTVGTVVTKGGTVDMEVGITDTILFSRVAMDTVVDTEVDTADTVAGGNSKTAIID